MKLSLCIVGCGSYSKTVLRDIQDLTDEFSLYFASRDPDKAKEFCNAYNGAGYFGSYEEAAADPQVQALYFLTPHHVHLENVRLAASHSKHVLMEKPIARTLAESRELIQAARDARVKLMVAENYRFLPTVIKAREIIKQGFLGDVRLIQLQAESYRVPGEWRVSAELVGGGVFIDGGIHFVDVLLYLGGFPERVYALKPPQTFRQVEGEDGLVMTASLPGGAVGLINFSRATTINEVRQWVAVTGTKGYMRFVPYGDELTFETEQGKRTIALPEARRGVRGMVREFRSSILEDREPTMSGEEGLRDLAIVLGAYQSAAEGREVTLTPP
jgi:predicted dehydrogenase